jgi:serine/threonine protein kinase
MERTDGRCHRRRLDGKPMLIALDDKMTLYKYQLQQRIGKGQFGEVWLAHDAAIARQVAIKVLDESMAPLAEVLREAQFGNRLAHQNVVKVHNADVIDYGGDSLVIIVMDYLPNGSVTRLGNAANFVIAPKAIAATIDVLRGLEYLHNGHLFHNDIKPSNILIGSRGEALLTDYGISCPSPNLMPAVAPSAYVLHRAPETLVTGSISVTTDIYQTGLTLFRLLNGFGLVREQRARLGNAEFEAQKAKGNVPADEDFQPFIGKALRKIIRKATAPNPANRFQSALEMRRSLEKLNCYGYWDADASGQLVGYIRQKQKITYSIYRNSAGFILSTNREYLESGRTTRVGKYCATGLKEAHLHQLKKKMMQEVSEGTL